VLLPGVSVLARLVSAVRTEQAERLYAALAEAAGPATLKRLESLLRVDEGFRVSGWERLRSGPTRVSVPELLRQADRLVQLRGLGLSDLDVAALPAGPLNALARFGMAGKAPALRDLAPARRAATLVATVRALTIDVADDLCDALDLIITQKVIRRAERESAAVRLRSLPRLSKASAQLADAATVLIEVLSDTAPRPADLHALLSSRINVDKLADAVGIVTDMVGPAGQDDLLASEMLRRFTTVRAVLPALVRAAPFGSTSGGAPVLAALNALPAMLARRTVELEDIDLAVLPASWQRLVVADGKVDRRAYTLAVVEALHRALRRRDVFVIGGRRWGDPQARLLSAEVWASSKNEVLAGLQLIESPAEHLESIAARLDASYRTAAEELPANTAVRIDQGGKVHLSPLEALAIPDSLDLLRATTAAMLPRVDLPELLLEVDSWTGFLSEFTHVSEATARMGKLNVSVAAVLVAEACNVGLIPVINDGDPALSRARLLHVDQNYVRAGTLRAANARLISAQSDISLATMWGGGLLASADGMRFVVPVATVNAGANPRYFGRGRGLTWLNYLNDQVTGLGAVVVPGTVRDSLYILDGLLDLDGGQRPDMVATDTASYSDQVFGLFTLLGYRFSPRLADLPDQRFWRIDPDSSYGPLDEVVGRNRINLPLIMANWPDMLRLAGSLVTGSVRASEILRVTQGNGTPALLGRALAEYGRIAKSLHLLAFIDIDDSYRRQIHTQLTVQESRHALARRIFHGRRGQIHQSYREGQEDQLGALGLVLNAIVLWNTRYLDHALTELRSQGTAPIAADIARLSPLGSTHINMLGRYSFPATPASGQLRPLRDPALTDDS